MYEICVSAQREALGTIERFSAKGKCRIGRKAGVGGRANRSNPAWRMGGAKRYPSTLPVGRWVSLRSTHPTILEYDSAFSRRDAPGVLHFVCPRKQRAQGRPDARCTRGLMCVSANKNLHMSIQVQLATPGLPCAMALRLIRDRPGDPAFCDTIALGQRWPPSNLTPAWGRRTQTISPYASAALVSRGLTSTAPCPSFATMANAPLAGQDAGVVNLICPTRPAENFGKRD